MADHQIQDFNEQFNFSGKLATRFLIVSAVGVVLLVMGLLGSNWAPASHGHGEDHGDSGEHASMVDKESAHSNATMVSLEGQEEGHESHDSHAEEGHGGGHGDHADAPGMWARFGGMLLISNMIFLVLSCFGPWFIGINYLAKSAWYVSVKRIMESYYRYLPIVMGLSVLFWVLFVFLDGSIYEWSVLEEGASALVDHKRPFLNKWFNLVAMILLPLIAFGLGFILRKNSIAEDAQGGTALHFKSVKISAIFMPLFMIAFLYTTWQWLMGIDAKWYSTIYWVYILADMIVIGVTTTILIITYLRQAGYMKMVSDEHVHDLGKYMFAFSVFWAYIWISQYLLIWYANIPEETVYYNLRQENYGFFFWVNVLINFIFPFLALMTRAAKRAPGTIKLVGFTILFGRVLDIWLLVIPGMMGGEGNEFFLLIAGVGMVMIQAGIWLFIIFKGIAGAPLYPKNHPYLQESFHHDVGV